MTRMGSAGERVLLATRWTALAIVPFLAVAVVLLLAVPERSGELFAWAIAPPLSAWLLGAAYVGGIVFFVAVARAREWHRVRHGFPAVVVFAGALLAATALHFDRFSTNLSAVVWIALYATTPFAIAALAIVQRRAERSAVPGARHAVGGAEVLIPAAARAALVAIGLGALATGAALFVAPAALAPLWAWELTPLTARVTGATLSLTGVVHLAMVRDARWSAFRILYLAQLSSLAVIALALVVHADDVRWQRPAAGGFVALVALAIAAYGALTLWAEGRRRGRRRPR